jgi:hypothetical protein
MVLQRPKLCLTVIMTQLFALAEPMIAMIAWEVQLGEQKSWV